jgi:cell division protein FtsN
MATFQNVSGVDREVSVDGRLIPVVAGGSFDVADEFASTLREQPYFAEQGTTQPAAVAPVPPAPAPAPAAPAPAPAPAPEPPAPVASAPVEPSTPEGNN